MKTLQILFLGAIALSLSACGLVSSAGTTDDLTASGVISATSVNVAPEMSGRVQEVYAKEGDTVTAGDALVRFDCSIVEAQRAQAKAGVAQAEAGLAGANAASFSALAQYALTRQGVEQQNTPNRVGVWNTDVDNAIELPSWYFQNVEQITAATAEVEAAETALDVEKANLADELKKVSNSDFVAAESRLAEAQIAFGVATLTHDQAQDATNNVDLTDVTEIALNSAENELNSAQSNYDRMLTTSSAKSVMEARARVSAAQARLDNAGDVLRSLRVGAESLQIKAAQASVDQANTGITQASIGLTQAQATLTLLDLQVEKCVVSAPRSGVITARNLENGEIAPAGGIVMTISELSPLTLTVYVPEDQYGLIDLGQRVSISVDSFANQTFTGVVRSIADEGEFTPRNVQTADGRKATVYAVKIEVQNEDELLKPGMPADVLFLIQ